MTRERERESMREREGGGGGEGEGEGEGAEERERKFKRNLFEDNGKASNMGHELIYHRALQIRHTNAAHISTC